jgi:hypothetical protein
VPEVADRTVKKATSSQIKFFASGIVIKLNTENNIYVITNVD